MINPIRIKNSFDLYGQHDTIGILYESSQSDTVFQKIRLKDLLP